MFGLSIWPKAVAYVKHHGVRPDDAEDVVQTTLQAILAVGERDPVPFPRAYFYKALHSHVVEYHRHTKPAELDAHSREIFFTVFLADRAPSPDEQIEMKDRLERVAAFIKAECSASERRALLLHLKNERLTVTDRVNLYRLRRRLERAGV